VGGRARRVLGWDVVKNWEILSKNWEILSKIWDFFCDF
jgi:hypothetical protein